MKIPKWVAIAIAFSTFAATECYADLVLPGSLDSSATWDRTKDIPLQDAAPNGVAYDIIRFKFDAADPDIQLEITSTASNLNTTMYFFQDTWDVDDPLGTENNANAIAYDVNSGSGLLSAIGSSFGSSSISVVPGQVYGVIVSGFNQVDSGDFSLNITSIANVTAVPEPNLAIGILSLTGICFARRRRQS